MIIMLFISWFFVFELVDIFEDICVCILEVQEKSGFVLNVFLVLLYWFDECCVFFVYYDVLMLCEGSSFIKGECEMIVVVMFVVNQCLYCVVVYGVILCIYEKKLLLVDQIVVNYCKVDIMFCQCVMFDFVMKVCIELYIVNDVDYEVLCVYGFDDEDIWDIIGIIVFFGLLNCMVNVILMWFNDEFFLFGCLLCEKK